MGEPLKDKKYNLVNPVGCGELKGFYEDDIKSAVGWCLQEINNPKNLNPTETIIKEAFEDVIKK